MTGRIAEIRARLNATKQAAWSTFYERAPSDIEWLLGQLEAKQ